MTDDLRGRTDPELLDRVRSRLARRGHGAAPAAVAEALRAERGVVGDISVLDAVEALRREAAGIGPLEDLLRLPGVCDIVVNGPDRVYVDVGEGLQRVEVRFDDDDAVRRLAQRLAAAAGRRLDDAAPFVDVRLADGTRFHAVLAPLARPGSCLSLRVPTRMPMSLEDLEARGLLDPAAAVTLREVIRRRIPFLISGGTGTGKTTLLAALLSEVDPRERLVIVEDSAELNPRHPHVVGLEARTPNVEGVGEVSLRDLVRQAMRMRPDRLIVGEVRGPEVVDMLAAMNTGHEGSCATVHANSAGDVPARIEALGVMAGLPPAAVATQIGSALQVVIHLRRSMAGRRELAEIAVLTRSGPSGRVAAEAAVAFRSGASAEAGPGAERLGRLLGADR